MNFLKGLLWILALPFVVFYILFMMLTAKLMANSYKKDPESIPLKDRYKKVNTILSAIFYLIAIKPKIENREMLFDKTMLYVGNHKSNIDPLVIFSILYKAGINVTFVAKKELEKSFFSPLFDLIDTIYIDRNNLRQVAKTIELQKNMVKETGRGLVIFPEGTRMIEEDFGDFKPGALTSAYETKASIQPFAIANDIGCLELKDKKNNKLPHRNLLVPREVIVSFLNPINSFDYMNINKEITMKKIRGLILNEYLRLKKVYKLKSYDQFANK
ncbi:lysophospholipid acyltransferase family protein [Ureaplasma canigenitalium]|uniref:lysophospholipid acyltransferase family protein n=1 Tax=Ureaplasma canigenitalium TaxID=42092 RepID=UPI000A0391F9|nr:lysophospholipid acyltransferase family protein [Ureaplasma canigenitalium]